MIKLRSIAINCYKLLLRWLNIAMDKARAFATLHVREKADEHCDEEMVVDSGGEEELDYVEVWNLIDGWVKEMQEVAIDELEEQEEWKKPWDDVT